MEQDLTTRDRLLYMREVCRKDGRYLEMMRIDIVDKFLCREFTSLQTFKNLSKLLNNKGIIESSSLSEQLSLKLTTIEFACLADKNGKLYKERFKEIIDVINQASNRWRIAILDMSSKLFISILTDYPDVDNRKHIQDFLKAVKRKNFTNSKIESLQDEVYFDKKMEAIKEINNLEKNLL